MKYTLVGECLVGDDGHVIELDSETLVLLGL